jgi:hypothetical protein
LPIGLTINSDLHIYPKFEQTLRSYWVTINHKNPITNEITQLLRKEFVYGTTLEEILTSTPNRITPYVEDLNNTLSLREGYNFIGYSLV